MSLWGMIPMPFGRCPRSRRTFSSWQMQMIWKGGSCPVPRLWIIWRGLRRILRIYRRMRGVTLPSFISLVVNMGEGVLEWGACWWASSWCFQEPLVQGGRSKWCVARHQEDCPTRSCSIDSCHRDLARPSHGCQREVGAVYAQFIEWGGEEGELSLCFSFFLPLTIVVALSHGIALNIFMHSLYLQKVTRLAALFTFYYLYYLSTWQDASILVSSCIYHCHHLSVKSSFLTIHRVEIFTFHYSPTIFIWVRDHHRIFSQSER